VFTSAHRCLVVLHTVRCDHTLRLKNLVYVTPGMRLALEGLPHRSLSQTSL